MVIETQNERTETLFTNTASIAKSNIVSRIQFSLVKENDPKKVGQIGSTSAGKKKQTAGRDHLGQLKICVQPKICWQRFKRK